MLLSQDKSTLTLRWRSPWAAGTLLFAVYVGTALGTTWFVQSVDPSIRVMSVAVPWFAVGIGVAGVLLGGTRLWPAIFLGSWTVWGGVLHHSVITVTVDAFAEAGSIVLIVRLLSLWGFGRDFDRLSEALTLEQIDAGDELLGLGKRTVCHKRLTAARAH